MNKLYEKIILRIALIYGIAAQLFGAYFFWSYIKAHTFGDFIFFGFLIPVFKAVIWPYFAWHLLNS